jgi:cell division protein ZapE
MELLERYRALVAAGSIVADPAQARAVERLTDLTKRLSEGAPRSAPPASPLRRLLGALPGARERQPPAPVRGLYLWGGVGRGKTWLMDMFYECLPFDDRHRSHFHRFMYEVHARLRELEDEQNPLERVASGFAARARVLCFDEFFVSDITDAMLLGTLFRALFARGVTLVATSNVPPAELYRDGLQRARFLPAIDLLETHTEVLNVDGGTDYRLRLLERAEIYHHPLEASAEANLRRYFDELCPDTAEHGPGELRVEGRAIPVRAVGDGVVWFDFDAICDGPRSQADYLAIAAEFHTVLVSAVPQLSVEMENQARRFIALVDEFYDRRVKLILSAAVPAEALYAGEKLRFEFDRTVSRLLEMQTHEYLAAPHIP